MISPVDVAIVGAGPVGLVLGVQLAQRGRSAVILERQSTPYPLPRAVHSDHEVGRILQSCGIGDAVRRRIDFVHAPVPKRRSDDVYFAPLAAWRRRPETRLYLGLIHFDDRAGDAQRITAARRVIPDFGIASECGWGRTDPARVPGLLASHRAAAEALL